MDINIDSIKASVSSGISFLGRGISSCASYVRTAAHWSVNQTQASSKTDQAFKMSAVGVQARVLEAWMQHDPTQEFEIIGVEKGDDGAEYYIVDTKNNEVVNQQINKSESSFANNVFKTRSKVSHAWMEIKAHLPRLFS